MQSQSFQVQVVALDQFAMGALPAIADLSESDDGHDDGKAKTPKKPKTTLKRKNTDEKPAPSSSKPAAPKTPKAKATTTPKAKAKASAKQKAKAPPKAKTSPKVKSSDKQKPAEDPPSEAQSRSMISLPVHFYDGIFCCQVSAKKRPAAKMPQKPKTGPSISNPQFHKGCQSWGLKLGKKLLLSVEC